MICPKCKSNKVFNALYVRKTIINMGNTLREIKDKKYTCLNCGHKFDYK